MKLAIVHKEKCKPTACGHECKKCCPVEKKEADSCVTIPSGIGSPVAGSRLPVGDKARIDENSCVGCAICVKRCPFGAIDIVNLPSVKEEDLVYRYGENGFALYGLPVPRGGSVLGLLGRNGIGKSTAVSILAGINPASGVSGFRGFGVSEAWLDDVRCKFKGTELQGYFDELHGKKISYKPQNLSALAVDVGVMDLLLKRGKKKDILELAEKLNVSNVLGNKMDKLSGGELQRVAILAASLGGAVSDDKAQEGHIYFFDEPLAFLDIGERIRVSDFIKEIGVGKSVIVVEHDLLMLDYLTDYLNVFYGGQGAFGTVSGVKGSKEGVNAYLHGFLKEENLRIRDKALKFNFTKNPALSGAKIAEWPAFDLEFPRLDSLGHQTGQGFRLEVGEGAIHENHVVGILGKNGTGKTSFIKALVGELDVAVGSRQSAVGKLDLGLDVSYKAQYLFSDSEEVVRDVMFREKINKKLASTFNLGVLAGKKVKELSGGELQRFSIARCLAKDADVYLIDEPSAYLDVEERISVAKAIKDVMVERSKTAFVVDHDLLLVSYLADSVINFSGVSGESGVASGVVDFEVGVSELLKSLDITLRKDKDSGRPRINKKGSVLDREQKEKGKWAIF
ncbi:MAG: ribosome biogenesis/translation initiation ATPase RLI [Nanoarchaeota archaeon]|nr:ribosome biogenesis/translation initiation ATPase RLI [Nanoarchaeota archaeon]